MAKTISKRELKKVIEAVMRSLERDPGPTSRLLSVAGSQRIEITDVGLVLNIGKADAEGRLPWSLSDEVDWQPDVELKMDAETANRYMQGRESIALAIVRRRISASCEARAALRTLPAARMIFERYRELVERDFPHLAA